MSHWLPQADGSYLGAATDRSQEWAGGDCEKLASIGFVAFCRDMQLDPDWKANGWNYVELPGWGVMDIRLDESDEPDHFDIGRGDIATLTYAVVRVFAQLVKQPVIHILGVTSTHKQLVESRGELIPRSQLLSPREWLRAFPVHHVPYTEAAQ